FTMEKSKEMDLIGRYASRLQRDYRNALKDLQTLQAARKQREQEEMQDAAAIARLYSMHEQPFHPVDLGFVLRTQQIDTYLLREQLLHEAAAASRFDFDLKKYRAASGN